MSQGRHRKPSGGKAVRRIALGAGIAIGGAVVPSTFASAATVDQWDRIAACESGDMNTPGSGQWNLPYGHASSTGGLQIQLPTWIDYGGQAYAPEPYLATKAQQIAVAERILAGQGPGAWVCNSPGHGIASGALSGQPGNQDAQPDEPTPDPEPTTPDPAPTDPAPDPEPEPESPGPVTPTPEGGRDYTVKAGDSLSKIARAEKVRGGWEALYEANKEAVGCDPNLIMVGLVLKLPLSDPYEFSGLPTPNESSPSAVELQKELIRNGYLPADLETNANYGPKTQQAVSNFHEDEPQFSWGGHDVTIGPKGWAFLLKMDGPPMPDAETPPPAEPTDPEPTEPTPDPEPEPPAPVANYHKPTASGFVSQHYGNAGGGYTLGYHTGTDISAPTGTETYAIANGVVVASDTSSAYGINVLIKHDDGKYSLYAHLSGKTVSAGTAVSAGDLIGYVGSTGNSSGPHLHLEVRHSSSFGAGNFLNPVTYLSGKGVNL